ncbi:hypothetical protein ACLIBH_05815 [Virgibacillus sp. W0430]|uniref:hypothetical protein n=1 Tax=Virgibacillus sp. W0430 TaxID=3391580 RepID=UPI003F481865
MKQFAKLLITGILSGYILAFSLKIVKFVTHNKAYDLLFNMDYIPIIQDWQPSLFWGICFHYVTCILSVVLLFYILKLLYLERSIHPYVLVYSIGGGALFFLTSLSAQPPAATDFAAWFFWTAGHAVFGVVVGLLIKYWE